jgi:hypothetical protein
MSVGGTSFEYIVDAVRLPRTDNKGQQHLGWAKAHQTPNLTYQTLFFPTQVAHIVDDERRVDVGWAEATLATTANFAPESTWWTQFSGGLNYQVL